MWGVFGAAMLALGWYEWQALTRDRTAPVVVAGAGAPSVAPAPVIEQPAPVVVQAPPIVPQAEPAPAQAAPAPTARMAPARPPAPAAVPRPRPDAGLAPPRDAPVRAAAKPASAASIPAADARIYAFNELPESVRRELPPLAIGGSIYSDSASSRFLIINGRIFHENDRIAPDLTLEQIKLKAAVLRYKGYRYGITY